MVAPVREPLTSPPAGAPSVEVSSTLAAPADTVWRTATTMEGVNAELRPWLRMSSPRGAPADLRTVVPGERAFRSWLLLLGVLPVDFDDLTLVEIGPGRRFLERSPMLSARVWEHERVVQSEGSGARVTDRVRFVPRVGLAGGVQRRIVAAVFAHRHRRLRRHFGRAA